MNIAFLGLGKMGTPMARRLMAAGNELTVWNRNPGLRSERSVPRLGIAPRLRQVFSICST